jgi:hypothetical protein
MLNKLPAYHTVCECSLDFSFSELRSQNSTANRKGGYGDQRDLPVASEMIQEEATCLKGRRPKKLDSEVTARKIALVFWFGEAGSVEVLGEGDCEEAKSWSIDMDPPSLGPVVLPLSPMRREESTGMR